MSTPDIHHLAAAYALDALDADERAHFEAHYPDCDICVSDVVDFRAVLANLAQAHAETPPAALKARVMGDIATTRQLSPRVPERMVRASRQTLDRRRRWVTAGLAVAASLVLAVGGGFVIGRSGGGDSYSQTASELLDRPDTRVVELAGSGTGMFRVTWSPSSGEAVVTADGLAAPGDGRAYELWLIDDDGPRPLRLLDNADDGTIRRVINIEGDGLVMGVTVEPEQGSPAPTNDILFSAELGA
jgi:anti-sigma-K factor RskA